MSPSTDTRENRELATEMKFLVSPALAGQILAWARHHLSPDPHAGGPAGDGYEITSLYFDTAQFDVFHRRGSFGRSKYRIRRYGEGQVAFLERKLKTRGLLTKRRSIVRLDELESLAADDGDHVWAGRWFHRRLLARALSPACQISYQRTALVAMTSFGPIRLTMDSGLRALPTSCIQFSNELGAPLLEDQIILELKFRYGLPALFKYLVEEFALTPAPFSKYRLAAAALGIANAPDAERQQSKPPPSGAASVFACVAQVSKPAVSPISQSANHSRANGTRVWKPATQQTWKSAPRLKWPVAGED